LGHKNDEAVPLNLEEFLALAERLTREEIVHSLLAVDSFFDLKGDKRRLRVRATHGYSGPKQGDPSLAIVPPPAVDGSTIVVLDDTGNRFRRSPEHWPATLRSGSDTGDSIVVYKLHRPFSGEAGSHRAHEPEGLWHTVAQRFDERRIVIVSVDDLRELDVPISRGLSWERTALDVVWGLMNAPQLAELCDCPHLIVRLGLDAAIYWRRGSGADRNQAWLVYDPQGIEGTGASCYAGGMVGFGSAFTAAVVGHLAQSCQNDNCPPAALLQRSDLLTDAIASGLAASRRLLALGFGAAGAAAPAYPREELFHPLPECEFASATIPILSGPSVPDRGFWRLLDSIFKGRTALLHKAVELTATGARPHDESEREAAALLKRCPTAVFAKALKTYDRVEIENYRALYQLMLDYVGNPNPPRPLSIAVFGPPGAGKSFGVKAVAKALSQAGTLRAIEPLTFNLSQYQSPEQLADAFHLVRDLVLRGRIPLVFFDEFDTSLGGAPLGWLRSFLAPMQDAEFLDDGVPHPIGQAIFVFAGGTCRTYSEFAQPFLESEDENPLKVAARLRFEQAKGPDFLSRLRGTLDVPGMDLDMPFDPYGPVEAFPCEAAILLRRAGIFAHQLSQKAPQMRDASEALRVSPFVIRALLHLPGFQHGNRSFEAVLDMSQLASAGRLNPSLLPSTSHVALHANPVHLAQLLATHYPFPPAEREQIAASIHRRYRQDMLRHQPAAGSSHPRDNAFVEATHEWPELCEELKESNRGQADHIATKLRSAGLWFRKRRATDRAAHRSDPQLDQMIEELARAEHDRWVAEKRRQGWIPAPSLDRSDRDDDLLLHNCLFPWEDLTEDLKEIDRQAVRQIPVHLAEAGYEIVRL
jgi:hypothetical protein